MAQLEQLQVFQSLNSSPNTRLHRSAELGDGLAAAVWSNRHDARDYQAPSHHTLSCYLTGGTGTFRRESPHSKGAPDKLCILPAGHQSAWVINGEIQLAHLYISQEQFALAAVNLLDREPRELELREGTFLDDPQQAQRFRQLSQLDWQEPAERLLSSSLAHGLINHTLLSQVGRREGLRLTGGLAPSQRRLVHEFIQANLSAPLSLGQLPGCARSPNTTSRGCSSSVSGCRRIVMCWRSACAKPSTCCNTRPSLWPRWRWPVALPVPATSTTASVRLSALRQGSTAPPCNSTDSTPAASICRIPFYQALPLACPAAENSLLIPRRLCKNHRLPSRKLPMSRLTHTPARCR